MKIILNFILKKLTHICALEEYFIYRLSILCLALGSPPSDGLILV